MTPLKLTLILFLSAIVGALVITGACAEREWIIESKGSLTSDTDERSREKPSAVVTVTAYSPVETRSND